MVAVYKQQARGLKDLPGQTASFVPSMLGEYVWAGRVLRSLGILTLPQAVSTVYHLRGVLFSRSDFPQIAPALPCFNQTAGQ
jgi:hypothetical protein